MIRNAVKKPMFYCEVPQSFKKVISDEGSINGEDYKVTITYPHLLIESEALNNDFKDKGSVLTQLVYSKPYQAVKNHEMLTYIIDGKECVLIRGKHYNQY